MTERPPREPLRWELSPRLLLGLALVALGLVMTLENLGFRQAEALLRFWPVLLVVAGVGILVQGRGGIVGGALLTAVGVWLTLGELAWIRWGLEDLWPVLLVVFGGSLVWQAFRPLGRSEVETDATFRNLAVWSGIHRRLASDSFRGGEVVAVMGASTIDLRSSLIAGGQAEVWAFAWWGGVEIVVPEDWSVSSRGLALMGAFEDSSAHPRGGSQQRLVVRGMALMGAVEIRNTPSEG